MGGGKMNIAKRVCEKLDMSPAECGELLLGGTRKRANDQFSGWINGSRIPSRATIKYFELILMLSEIETKNGGTALDSIMARKKT